METLVQIGEFGLIRRIRDLLEREGVKDPSVTVGIGDDTASFVPREGYELLVTCDSVVEGRHFLPQHTTPFDLGRRAMTLNISDIGAMGGHPLYALISLGLKGDTQVSYIEEMFRGFVAELNPFHASIIGGNITSSCVVIFIDVTLIGEVESGKKVRRSTARLGDAILVTGYPGESAAGLLLLLKSQLEEGLNPILSSRLQQAFPQSQRKARRWGVQGSRQAMIDTSDGFLRSRPYL
jgi:thiamine-monophosphate kinase